MKVLALHPEKCTGCPPVRAGVLLHADGLFQPSKSVIRVSPFEGYTSYAPYTCTQCAEGWCMTSCPLGAIQINAVGAKDVVDDMCVGCKLCTIACPYGTMFYDGDTQKAYKCNLCGGAPACASACPTEAITFEEAENADWIGDFAAERTARCSRWRAADAGPSPDHRRRHRGDERDPDDQRRGADAGLDPSEITLVSPSVPTRGWCCRIPLGHHLREPRVHASAGGAHRLEGEGPGRRKAKTLDPAARTLTLDDDAKVGSTTA